MSEHEQEARSLGKCRPMHNTSAVSHYLTREQELRLLQDRFNYSVYFTSLHLWLFFSRKPFNLLSGTSSGDETRTDAFTSREWHFDRKETILLLSAAFLSFLSTLLALWGPNGSRVGWWVQQTCTTMFPVSCTTKHLIIRSLVLLIYQL